VGELASLPDPASAGLSNAERERIAEIGDNKGCMELKGASRAHIGERQPDRWGLTHEHELAAKRWGIDANADLACTHKMAA